MNEPKKLRIISLEPRVIIINQVEQVQSDDSVEELIAAPFLLSSDNPIENLNELIDTVCEKFSEACGRRNLNWEAELEFGVEFGIKFSAKLKISPTTHKQAAKFDKTPTSVTDSQSTP